MMDIVDCDEGDQPQQATPAQDQPTAASCAMVVDIIGGSDDPPAILYGQKSRENFMRLVPFCFLSLWSKRRRIVLYEQKFEGIDIDLTPRKYSYSAYTSIQQNGAKDRPLAILDGNAKTVAVNRCNGFYSAPGMGNN